MTSTDHVRAWRAMTERKRKLGCADCGTTQGTLDFHHIEKRSFWISQLGGRAKGLRKNLRSALCSVIVVIHVGTSPANLLPARRIRDRNNR